jgi:flagella basal body P-ring formation protein FlgA
MRTLTGLILLAVLAGLRPAAAAALDLPAATPLTPAMVAGLVRDELAARGVAGKLQVELRQPAAPVPNDAGTAMRVTLVELRFDPRTGRVQGRLAAALPSGETESLAVGGRVDELVAVAVPGRPIPRDTVIGPDDLRIASLPVASLPEDALRRAEELVGRQAARALAGGRPVRAAEVAAPWAVRRGDEVGMVFRRGGLQIVTAGEMLEHARLGETARVRNLSSSEVRQATVLGPRRVEVQGIVP